MVMDKHKLMPDYIFESSWEVCNKVGGIYTVLSTRADTLQKKMKDRIIFIGPDCWKDNTCPYFEEEPGSFAPWIAVARAKGLKVRAGRWLVPGKPLALLVDYSPLFARKNEFYARMWEWYGVDSLHAYGDYDESSMFSLAAGMTVESFYHYYLSGKDKVVYQCNEWMTGMGMLYVRHEVPQIATIFTTHATSIGRSIAGNGKPLYQYFTAYNGDQMAGELNMQSKHSIEKQAALNADCFTTVSEITARECSQLLDKPVDVVLPNGFDNAFVPKGAAFTRKRTAARKKLLAVANALTGCPIDDNALIVSTSGRYEFRNKGIDVFIDAMVRLSRDTSLNRQVVAFIEVPAWVKEPRQDLKQRLAAGKPATEPLANPVVTHWLHEPGNDRVLTMLASLGFRNEDSSRVKIIFIPCYLTGNDGIVNISYYDVMTGNDLCIYPSYYEPWGYTPLEAVAFGVPCITTNLAGFGLWTRGEEGEGKSLESGALVVDRTDTNYNEVADTVEKAVCSYAAASAEKVKLSRRNAAKLSRQALWSKFITNYYQAYDFALKKAALRSTSLIKEQTLFN